jgi:hypothetical protein
LYWQSYGIANKYLVIITWLFSGGDNNGALQFTCELDEYAELAKCIKESGFYKDHRQGLIHNYKNTFVGKEVVDWLMFTRQIGK